MSWALIIHLGMGVGDFMWILVMHSYIAVGEVIQCYKFFGSMPGWVWFVELHTLNETCRMIIYHLCLVLRC